MKTEAMLSHKRKAIRSEDYGCVKVKEALP